MTAPTDLRRARTLKSARAELERHGLSGELLEIAMDEVDHAYAMGITSRDAPRPDISAMLKRELMQPLAPFYPWGSGGVHSNDETGGEA